MLVPRIVFFVDGDGAIGSVVCFVKHGGGNVLRCSNPEFENGPVAFEDDIVLALRATSRRLVLEKSVFCKWWYTH